MKNDLIRTVATIALTLVTSATFVLGAVGPAQAGAQAGATPAPRASVQLA